MDNEIESIVQALINGETIKDFKPRSRTEAYLKSALMKKKIDDLPNPQSRLDVLLCMMNDVIHREYSTKFDEGYAEGNTEGYDAGHDVGYSEGNAAGLETGRAEGYEEGYSKGNEDGLEAGYNQGNQEGYDRGYDTGYSEGNTAGYADGHANGVSEGYDRGYESGYSVGVTDGTEAGKQAEYDAFWDYFQNYGNRKHYGGCFGAGFNSKNLKPKYPIKPVKSYSGDSVVYNMFCYTNRDQTYEALTDISHIKFDFSKINSKVNDRGLNYMFHNAYVDNIILDLTNVTSTSNLFNYSDSDGSNGPKTITLTVTESLTSYSNTFHYLKSPTKIIFTEGSVIARSINFQYCTKLIVESAISIINALKNYLGTDNELKYTLTLPSAVWDRLEASGTPPSEATWKDYVMYVKGWKVA